MDLCRLCEKRRPRRYCPGVRGEICSQCCGAEREVTVECPFDCEYLAEARRHEKLPELTPAEIPNGDIRVTEGFLRDHEELLMVSARALFDAAMQIPGAIDFDVREALEALIKTYRTLQSGLVYESRPANPMAAGVQQLFERQVRAYRDAATQRAGMNVIRDADVLGVLVFLQRMEIQHNNGRRRGRAFLDLLRGFLPPSMGVGASQVVTA